MYRTNTDIDQFKQYQLGTLEKHLLNDFQQGFPLVSRPFQQIAEKMGVTEDVVISTLRYLQEQGFISRVGAVFRANSIGASTLAAMAVPEDRLQKIADMICGYSEVNHNYQRDHHYNLWFVATAPDEQSLNTVLDDIEQRSGLPVMFLPMLEDFHINLGFDLKWT